MSARSRTSRVRWRRYSEGRARRLTASEALAERFAQTPLGQRYLLHAAPKIDRVMLPRTNGHWSSVGRDLVGMVTTTGAKSGTARPQPLVCIPDHDGSLLVVGSNYGKPTHPAWSYNLIAHQRCTVTFRGSTSAFNAKLLEGVERERAWQRAVDWIRGYSSYERTAAPREIRVFRLLPRAKADVTGIQGVPIPENLAGAPKRRALLSVARDAVQAWGCGMRVRNVRASRWTRLIGGAAALALFMATTTVHTAHADTDSTPPPKCEAANCLDPLFTVQFPHRAIAATRAGVTFPVPVHYYDAALFGAIGTADITTERKLTANTDYQPLVTSDGQGIGALLVADYADDDLGPYHEAMVAFPVRRGASAVVSNDPGAMVAAILDPANEVWGVRLLLDHQFPIDVGREYLGIPKVPTAQLMALTITPTHTSFDFTERDGTPIASGDIVLDQRRGVATASDLATQASTASVVAETLRRSYVHLNFVYRDVRHPSAVASSEVAARVGVNAQVVIAPFDAASSITANPDAPFGSDLARLGLHPTVSVVLENLHVVLDATL